MTKLRRSSHFRRAALSSYDHGAPIWRIPFGMISATVIGMLVMTVLLTIRPPTHAVVIDFPPPPWAMEDAPRSEATVHHIGITENGMILWNGEAVNQRQLVEALSATYHEPIQPGIIFEPDANASYDMSLRVLNIVSSMGLADWAFCFGGITQYRQFGHGDRVPSPILPRDESRECDPRRAVQFPNF